MHWDYQPDIIDFAKAVTSGYIPMGGAIATPEIASKFEGDVPFGNIHTWGGNPAAAAGALAYIAIMEREILVENSAKMGEYMLEGFRDRFLGIPIVGDIRGIGLMLCIELVADKKTKTFFRPEQNVNDMVQERMEKEGLLCRLYQTNLIFTPPLIITKSDIDEIINILDRVISGVAKELGY